MKSTELKITRTQETNKRHGIPWKWNTNKQIRQNQSNNIIIIITIIIIIIIIIITIIIIIIIIIISFDSCWSVVRLLELSRQPDPDPAFQVVSRCNPPSFFSLQIVVQGVSRATSLSYSLWVPGQGLTSDTGCWLLECLSSPSPASLEDLIFWWLLLSPFKSSLLLMAPGHRIRRILLKEVLMNVWIFFDRWPVEQEWWQQAYWSHSSLYLKDICKLASTDQPACHSIWGVSDDAFIFSGML